MPPFVHVRPQSSDAYRTVGCLLEAIDLEWSSGHPHARAITNYLVHVLIMKVALHALGRMEGRQSRILQASLDPHVGRALALMHEKPELPWTVSALAARAAMSRSAFCARFVVLVGKSPIEYLTEWRMVRACQLLRYTEAGIKEVAARIGYGSAAAFGKAFARWAGTTPHAYRCGAVSVAPAVPQAGGFPLKATDTA